MGRSVTALQSAQVHPSKTVTGHEMLQSQSLVNPQFPSAESERHGKLCVFAAPKLFT
jgi:hypothetical protein